MYLCELNSVWQKETEVRYSSLESINNEELSKDYESFITCFSNGHRKIMSVHRNVCCDEHCVILCHVYVMCVEKVYTVTMDTS